METAGLSNSSQEDEKATGRPVVEENEGQKYSHHEHVTRGTYADEVGGPENAHPVSSCCYSFMPSRIDD